MSWAVTTLAANRPLVQSSQTLSSGDQNFTFNAKTNRAWISVTVAAVTLTLAAASSGNAVFTFPIGYVGELRIPDLAGMTVTLVGSTAVVGIIEYLNYP